MVVRFKVACLSVCLSVLISCSEEEEVASISSALTCSNPNVVLTADYVGSKEGLDLVAGAPNSAEVVGHAADVELVYGPSSRYAAAWISASDGKVRYAIYDGASQQLTTPANNVLPYRTGTYRKWLRRLGHSSARCDALPGANTCAWFTWQDMWGYVNWVAIGPEGQQSTTKYLVGRDGSGDEGYSIVPIWMEPERKKLLAYISSDRSQVRVLLLDTAGNRIIGSDQLMRQVPSGWMGYQTAVAYQVNDQRWLVTWSEYQASAANNGHIRAGYVTFAGSVSGEHHVMYCERDPYDSQCGVNAPTPPSDAGVPDAMPSIISPGFLSNPTCVCYGYWLAASNFSTSSADRYRIHQYRFGARLNASGTAYPIQIGNCEAYCPLGMAYFDYGTEGSAWYQRTKRQSSGTEQHHLAGLATTEWLVSGTVHNQPTPQALRTPGGPTDAAASLACSSSTPSTLVLSMLEQRAGGCP